MGDSFKISDTDQEITKGSRADQYWNANFVPHFKKLRPNLKLPKELEGVNSADKILKAFNIKAFGFGNWVTTEDRMNYINAMLVALYDLNKIVGFNMNMGLFNTLSVTFGARGSGTALAHFEPSTNIINITRYKRGITKDDDKERRFLETGGVHSFAHEYGHFLDYFAGSYLDKTSIFALSGGCSTSKERMNKSNGGAMRKTMDDILERIIWKVPRKEESRYYIGLIEVLKADPTNGEYWVRRTELFARAFEVYVSIELDRMGIINEFLVKKKYLSAFYPTKQDMKPILPLFKELIKLIADKVKKRKK